MIPELHIFNWQKNVSWQTLTMIEQDLIISRALISLYSNPKIRDSLVFRGGTAVNKLYINPPARFSEDIDFVQKKAEPIGETLSSIRRSLEPWLGEPKRKITERGVKLIYKYTSIDGSTVKLKIEINTTEHFQALDLNYIPYSVDSDWFTGDCVITTYQLEELMATKLRALYQRRKGRDLFDLWFVSSKNLVNLPRIIEIFYKYCNNDNRTISKDIFLKNIELKRSNTDFQKDMNILLPNQLSWNFEEAFEYVQQHIINRLDEGIKEETTTQTKKQSAKLKHLYKPTVLNS